MDNDFFNENDVPQSDDLETILFSEEPVSQEPEINVDSDVQVINTVDDLFEDNTNSNTRELSAFDDYLNHKGITNSKIKVYNEESKEEEEVDFHSLPKDEQLEVLLSLDQQQLPYSDEELGFIHTLQQNGLTVDQYLDYYRQSIIDELSESAVHNYEIDSYSDQELFLLDLKNRFDLSEDELKSELETELQNEDTFKKKVDKLREEYKGLEDRHKAAEQEEFERQQQHQYHQFADALRNVAVSNSDLHGIELDDDEKNITLDYILRLDNSGQSQFYKDLNAPENIYKVAWYMKYGDQAFNLIQDSYERQIARLKQELNTRQDKRTVVRQRPQNKNSNFI